MGSYIKYTELTKQQLLSLDLITTAHTQTEMEGIVDALVWCDDVTVRAGLYGDYHVYRILEGRQNGSAAMNGDGAGTTPKYEWDDEGRLR